MVYVIHSKVMSGLLITNLVPKSWKRLKNNLVAFCLFVWTPSKKDVSLITSYIKQKLLLQGVSHGNWIFKLALRDRSTNISFDLWCLVALGGVDICVSSTSFQKNYIGWPQQPPTESISDTSEKLEFWLSILQKGTVFGHLGARDDQIIMTSRFFDEKRLSRSLRLLRFLMPGKSLSM